MKRITVTFYDEIYEQLEVRMKIKGSKSVSHCVRELVDFGLKIEEAAEKNSENQSVNEVEIALVEIQKQLKNSLIWSLETRLLARYLVENLQGRDKEKLIEVLKQYKETASNHVNDMLEKV